MIAFASWLAEMNSYWLLVSLKCWKLFRWCWADSNPFDAGHSESEEAIRYSLLSKRLIIHLNYAWLIGLFEFLWLSIAFAWTWRCPLGLSSRPWFAQDFVDLVLCCNQRPRSSLHFWHISCLRILSPFWCPKSFCCGSSELLFWASLSLMVYLFQHFSKSKADWLTKFF